MRLISFREAKAGMVLARPIIDRQDRVIVNAGTRLSQLYISRLEKWGVQQLAIEEEAAGPAPGAAPAPAPAARPARPPAPPASTRAPLPPGVHRGPDLAQRIARTFSRVNDDPLMAALGQLVLRRLAGPAEGGGR